MSIESSESNIIPLFTGSTYGNLNPASLENLIRLIRTYLSGSSGTPLVTIKSEDQSDLIHATLSVFDAILKNKPDASAEWISSTELLNNLIKSARDNTLQSFSKVLISPDYLCLTEIEIFTRKHESFSVIQESLEQRVSMDKVTFCSYDTGRLPPCRSKTTEPDLVTSFLEKGLILSVPDNLE
jgi:hypothetical protein